LVNQGKLDNRVSGWDILCLLQKCTKNSHSIHVNYDFQ